MTVNQIGEAMSAIATGYGLFMLATSIIVCVVVWLITFLLKRFCKNKVGFGIIIVLNSLFSLVATIVTVLGTFLIIDDLQSATEWFNGLSLCLGLCGIVIAVPALIMSIANIVRCTKRKHEFIK